MSAHRFTYLLVAASGRYRCGRGNVLTLRKCCYIFRIDALALSVIAMATWLGGWVAGCLSDSCIVFVSKTLNLSANLF